MNINASYAVIRIKYGPTGRNKFQRGFIDVKSQLESATDGRTVVEWEEDNCDRVRDASLANVHRVEAALGRCKCKSENVQSFQLRQWLTLREGRVGTCQTREVLRRRTKPHAAAEEPINNNPLLPLRP